MRQKRTRLIKDTFRRFWGRAPAGTSWCQLESIQTTWKPWRWGRCGNTDLRHKRHTFRRGWAFWRWGVGVTAHIPSERRMLKRIYKNQRRAA